MKKIRTKKEKIDKSFNIPCSSFLKAKKPHITLMKEKRIPNRKVIST
jgi:hypothetical protein